MDESTNLRQVAATNIAPKRKPVRVLETSLNGKNRIQKVGEPTHRHKNQDSASLRTDRTLVLIPPLRKTRTRDPRVGNPLHKSQSAWRRQNPAPIHRKQEQRTHHGKTALEQTWAEIKTEHATHTRLVKRTGRVELTAREQVSTISRSSRYCAPLPDTAATPPGQAARGRK
jgi:hypothetical protein